MQGKIINITRFCTDDGPGIRTTVFLKGCPLKCAWCHNPESQSAAEEYYTNGEKIGRTVTAEQVVQEFLKDNAFYDASGGGVTVSGGEPLLQAEFTAEILRLCKEKHISTAVETSGYSSEKAFRSVAAFCDLVLFDIKETDPERHRLYTGVELSPILKNLEILSSENISHILRLPIIPSINDRTEHLEAVRGIAEKDKACIAVQIMPYHKLGEYKYTQLDRKYSLGNVEEPTTAQLAYWQSIVNK